MDRTLKTICGLLDSPDNMRRCAAAITLGEALQTANQTLAPYILEALEKIGSATAITYVMPLLDAEDVETKLRALGILSQAARTKLKQVK